MFEFVVVCKTYDYAFDEKKLKLFASTLKDVVLCWFMSLPRGTITAQDQMKKTFNDNY